MKRGVGINRSPQWDYFADPGQNSDSGLLQSACKFCRKTVGARKRDIERHYNKCIKIQEANAQHLIRVKEDGMHGMLGSGSTSLQNRIGR